MGTVLILQSMAGYIPDVEKGDFAFQIVLPVWRTVVEKGSIHLMKLGISIFVNKLTSLVRNAEISGRGE